MIPTTSKIRKNRKTKRLREIKTTMAYKRIYMIKVQERDDILSQNIIYIVSLLYKYL